MSLIQHTHAIAQFSQRLKHVESKTLIQHYALEALEVIHKQPESFKIFACIDAPFYQEFSNTIIGHSTNVDTCFSLLECLIIFFREKQLSLSENQQLSKSEQKILNFYETSNLWDLDDGTLMHLWYWHILPSKYRLTD